MDCNITTSMCRMSQSICRIKPDRVVHFSEIFNGNTSGEVVTFRRKRDNTVAGFTANIQAEYSGGAF